MMDDEGSKKRLWPCEAQRAKQTRPVETLILFTASAVFFLRCFTYIVHREESRYGQKADFGPAKPEGRSQTWPVEAFCPYLLSSKEDT